MIWVLADNHDLQLVGLQRDARGLDAGLRGGTYTLRINGTNNDGVWNEEGISLPVVMTPAPWKTWWAYSLYALVLASSVLGYVRWQRAKVERERAINRRRSASRRGGTAPRSQASGPPSTTSRRSLA